MKDIIKNGERVGFEGRFAIDADGNLRSHGPDLRLAGMTDTTCVVVYDENDQVLPGANTGRTMFARVVSVDAECARLDWRTPRPNATAPGILRVYTGRVIMFKVAPGETVNVRP